MKEKRKYSMRFFATIIAIMLISFGFVGGFIAKYMIVDEMSYSEAVEKIAGWNQVSAINV